MTYYRAFVVLLFTLSLSACSALKTTPLPPPAPQPFAQEINRAQSGTLQKIGMASVQVYGSPMDAEAALRSKANASGARYYLVIMNSDSVIPGQWYSQAILYR
ncbi:biofilm stress and motility protein A [Yersinia entomophaga]|uniref:Biofilm stress and motility protein A n=1 Tax=Yersinia entomophaga TaxID=935293 RepID=A0ABN4PUI6_YERET|nr:biofilm peroxide resistance protein BsmA [Yersinia entomophaga]ANI30707.1 biofilm stress and motility protein A [Yersinia entomophaga]OWF85620.1 biofilm peroxide resistance protein BsmA [Yersinia entomophaga]